MQTQKIEISRNDARDLYRKYKEHVHYSKPIDREIMRAYQLMAQGKLVIKALESIATAGVKEDGFPKLAIARADHGIVQCVVGHAGNVTMCSAKHERDVRLWGSASRGQTAYRFSWPDNTVAQEDRPKPERFGMPRRAATAPIVPVHLRPKRALQNYHVLFEAEWGPTMPVDPFLLRRIGKGDLWAVMAMWDLTDVERAALEGARVGR